jgi:hypothetical protein
MVGCPAGDERAVRSLKKEIEGALREGDLERVAHYALFDKKVFRILISLAYDKEDLLCWRSIEAMGRAAEAVAKDDPLTVRGIVQRLMWSIREESGGIGWSAPEMLGEIVVRSPAAFADIVPIILSFHEEESFLRGVLWAMGRMTRGGNIEVDGAYEIAGEALAHEDPFVRGLALYAIPTTRIGEAAGRIAAMTGDEGRFTFYEDHELVEMRVGEMARKVLNHR